MKTILIIFALFVCNLTFAQEINTKTNDDTKLPPLVLLKYPNIKDAFISKNNLDKDTFSLLEIKDKENPSLLIDNSRRANRNFAFSQPNQINLSKELLKITHRFPGDGSNLAISPKGLLVP